MKKQRSISSIMTIIFSITILLQVTVLLSVVYFGRVPQKVREDAYQNFDKDVSVNIASFNDTISSEKVFNIYTQALVSLLNKHFPKFDTIASSTRGEQLNFIEDTPKFLIELISTTNADAAYIIVVDEDLEISDEFFQEGIYISNDNVFHDYQYTAKVMSKDLNVDLYNIYTEASNENFRIDTQDNDYKFYNQLAKNTDSMYQTTYFSTRYQEYLKEEVINLAFPIYDMYGNCVVIYGVEYSIADFIKSTRNSVDITYILGYTLNNNFIVKPSFTWGKENTDLTDGSITISSLPTLDKYYSLVNDNTYAISVNIIDFYSGVSNPYMNETWVILGFIESNELTASSTYIETVILVIIFLSLIFGAVTIYITVSKVANPIKVLSDEVRERPNNNYYEFTKSNIEEVNNLILSFDKLSYDILQYSNKITNAINTVLLGIYFYQDDTKVYCTQAFLEMCDSKLKEGYIDRVTFDELNDHIVKSYYDKKYDAYQLNNNRWIKLETKVESSFTLGIVTDITDRVNELMKMEKELDIDGFTNLYNRIGFQKLATNIINEHSDKVIAVVMWDMDKLKYINDRYGHDTGDKYIMKFADIIRNLEKSNGIVARRSGDEFYAILYSDNKEEIIKELEKIRFLINHSSLEITSEIIEKLRASVGIAWYPENGKDLNSLLAYADKKLYQSKYEFEGLSNIVNTNIETHANLFHFNKELAKIIDGDYVTFAYQPIVSATTGEIFGYEMLMRIFSDILNNPKKLLDIARENEKLDIVEELTFKKGFESYQLNISNIKDKKIFLNSISNIKLADRAMNELLEITNNSLEMLVVELTNLLNADKQVVAEKVQQFKNLNAQIAIDNFKHEFIELINGNIDVDFIKVDMSIINNIESSKEQQEALEDIIRFARENNYKVVAVGISNYEELKIVINSGVDYLQGYYLSEPTVKPSNLKNEVILEIKKLQDN